jgi:hypothetical protein
MELTLTGLYTVGNGTGWAGELTLTGLYTVGYGASWVIWSLLSLASIQ